MPGDSKEIHSTQRQPASREAKGDERRVIGADAAAWARGCQSYLPNWGVVSLNSGCTSQPHITKSLQNMSRQVGEHGNVCPCAYVRPVMQMTLQASARDPIRQCGLRHGTLGSAGRGGLAFSARSVLILWGQALLCGPIPPPHHTFQGCVLLSVGSENNEAKSVPHRSHGLPPQGHRNDFGSSALLS